MTLDGGLARTYSGSANALTGASVITSGAGSTELVFDTPESAAVRVALGYADTDVSSGDALTLTSPGVMRVAPFDHVYLCSPSLARYGNTNRGASRELAIGLGGHTLRGVVARVPVTVNSFELLQYEPRVPERVCFTQPATIDAIGFELRAGDTGELLDLRGAAWSLTLRAW